MSLQNCRANYSLPSQYIWVTSLKALVSLFIDNIKMYMVPTVGWQQQWKHLPLIGAGVEM